MSKNRTLWMVCHSTSFWNGFLTIDISCSSFSMVAVDVNQRENNNKLCKIDVRP